MMDKKVITSREMRALEINAEYLGISRLQLMENAGRNIANELASRFNPQETRVAVFCGLGGNGGDGSVAARHLACLGFKVDVFLAGKADDILDKEARKNWHALSYISQSITLHEVSSLDLISDVNANVVIDALLGVGLKGTLRSPISALVEKINELNVFCISVDIPTGINSDSGEILGDAVNADLTITLHKMKPGLLKATEAVREVVVRDIGLPFEIEEVAGPGDVSLVTKLRPPHAYKGQFGRLLVIGGSEVFSGAPALVALAALRSGVDLTYIATPQKTAHIIASMSPNLITIKLEGTHLNLRNLEVIKRYLEISTAVVMGPGLGIHKETEEAVTEIASLIEKRRIPLLLDADGIKAFVQFKRRMDSSLVLTPHAGEYRLLTGKEPPTDFRERIMDVQVSARELGAVILLKGHVDVVSDGQRVKQNFTGNPGMTVGGTGDVLSGIVGAFLAQKADPFEAAVAGAFINGAAGDFVQREIGNHLVSTDLLDWIPKVMLNPMSHLEIRRLLR